MSQKNLTRKRYSKWKVQKLRVRRVGDKKRQGVARDRKARQTKINDLDKSISQDLLVSPDKVPVGERLMESSLCDVVCVRKELKSVHLLLTKAKDKQGASSKHVCY